MSKQLTPEERAKKVASNLANVGLLNLAIAEIDDVYEPIAAAIREAVNEQKKGRVVIEGLSLSIIEEDKVKADARKAAFRECRKALGGIKINKPVVEEIAKLLDKWKNEMEASE